MNITEELLDISEFDKRTDGKWKNEPIEFFGCPQCEQIVLGLPDCHTALVDPIDLKKHMTYNRPQEAKCPKCGFVWHENILGHSAWRTREITINDLLNSDWKWMVRGKV